MPKIITCVKTIIVKVGYVWHTDEIVGGMMIDKEACIATVMDGSSKFCLAIMMTVSPSKDGQNSKELFEEAGRTRPTGDSQRRVSGHPEWAQGGLWEKKTTTRSTSGTYTSGIS